MAILTATAGPIARAEEGMGARADLRCFDEQVRFRTCRIKYRDVDGEVHYVIIEVTTEHCRGRMHLRRPAGMDMPRLNVEEPWPIDGARVNHTRPVVFWRTDSAQNLDGSEGNGVLPPGSHGRDRDGHQVRFEVGSRIR